MKHKISKIIASLVAVLSMFSTLVITSGTVFATGTCTDICTCTTVTPAVKAAYGCSDSYQGSEEDFSNALQGILNGIIGTLGVIAVIVVIIGGVMYMTSNGDAGKLQRAKNTILYAAIGLIISVLAFAIVNFVILNIIGGRDRTGTSESSLVEEDA